MKILVFSDSHGNLDHMIAAMEEERPNHVFFLGDHERDGWDLSNMYPNIPVYAVKGNCDFGFGREDWLIELESVRFLLSHGHLYGVKTGLNRIACAAKQMQADVVCFGHTHIPMVDREIDGVALFNPGTIGGQRGQRATYGVLTIVNGTVKMEIKDTDQA